MKRPAYQWYTKDARSDEIFMLMTYEQQGIYRALLDHQWDEGSIPADVDRIAALFPKISVDHFKAAWPLISGKFRAQGNDRLVNDRLEAQRRELDKFIRSRRKAGSIGGKTRANHAIRSKRLAAARKIATHTHEEWAEMVAYFKGCCVSCGRSDMNVERDHIIPLCMGGHDGITNIQPLCASCNARKGLDTKDLRGIGIPSKWQAVLGFALTQPQANPTSSSSTATATKNNKTVPKEQAQAPVEKAPSPTREFLGWFQGEYKARRNGATYFVRWDAHSAIVKRLLTAFSADRLKKHAQILLSTDEDWTTGTDRGIEVLSAKINWLEERLCAWEAKRKAREAV